MLPLMTYQTSDHRRASSTSAGTTQKAASSKDRLMPSIPSAHRDALMTLNAPTTPYQHHLFNTLLGPNRDQTVSPPVQTPLEKPWKVYTETILDSGGIADDFYGNPLDWRYGHLLYGYANELLICDLTDGYQKTKEPMCIKTNNTKDTKAVHSAEWNPEQPLALVGYNDPQSTLSSSMIQVWDCQTQQKIRQINNPHKLYSLTWKNEDQTTTSRGNKIFHYDMRMNQVAWITQHIVITRSLRWNNNHYLAIGSDEGEVKLYDARKIQHCFFTYFHDTSVVKALRWHPANPSILATGGGASDQCLTIANVDQQKLRITKNLGNQICDLKWFDCSHLVLGLGIPRANTIRVESWDGKEGLQTVLCGNQKNNQRVLSVATSSEKTSFATLSKDYIMIHRLKEFKPYREMEIR